MSWMEYIEHFLVIAQNIKSCTLMLFHAKLSFDVTPEIWSNFLYDIIILKYLEETCCSLIISIITYVTDDVTCRVYYQAVFLARISILQTYFIHPLKL